MSEFTPTFISGDFSAEAKGFLDDDIFEKNLQEHRNEVEQSKLDPSILALIDQRLSNSLYGGAARRSEVNHTDGEPVIANNSPEKEDRTWGDLSKPVRADGTIYVHGKQMNDGLGSVRIRLDSGVDENGELNIARDKDSGRGVKLKPFAPERTLLMDMQLQNSILRHESTDTMYVPINTVDIIDDEISQQLAPEGLDEGRMILIPLDERSIATLNIYYNNQYELLPKFSYPEATLAPEKPEVEVPPVSVNDAQTEVFAPIADVDISQEPDTSPESMPAGEPETIDYDVEVAGVQAKEQHGEEYNAWLQGPENESETGKLENSQETKGSTGQTDGNEVDADAKPERPADKRDKQSRKLVMFVKERLLGKENRKNRVIAIVGSIAIAGGSVFVGAGYSGKPSDQEISEVVSSIESEPNTLEVQGIEGLIKTEVVSADGTEIIESPTISEATEFLNKETGEEVTRANFAEEWGSYISQVNEDRDDDEKLSKTAPDSVAINSATVEIAYDTDKGLVSGYNPLTRTPIVDLSEIDVTVDTTIDSANTTVNLRPLGDSVKNISADGKQYYNTMLKEQSDEITTSVAKQAEPAVSKSIIHVNKDEYTAAIKSQITKTLDVENIKFVGAPNFQLADHDTKAEQLTEKDFTRGVDAISVASAEKATNTQASAEGDN